jgi:glycolate oxidase FAD binding subunit
MKVVLADGRVISVGGKVVKNVAGYDLCKLFTGSYGTLGAIAELTFKLRPLPAKSNTAVLSGSLKSLLASCSSVRSALLSPVALEILSTDLAAALLSTSTPALLVRFAGSEKAVAYQLGQTMSVASQHGVNAKVTEDDTAVWRDIAALPYRRLSVMCRVVVPTTAVSDFLTTLESDCSWQASAGTGTIRVIGSERIQDLRTSAQRLGGSLVIESAPDEVRDQIGCWGDFGTVSPLMKRIKQQLDPGNLLSPNRF